MKGIRVNVFLPATPHAAFHSYNVMDKEILTWRYPYA